MRINRSSVGLTILALLLGGGGFAFLFVGGVDHFLAFGLSLVCFGLFWLVYGKAWESLQAPGTVIGGDSLPEFGSEPREGEFGTVFQRVEIERSDERGPNGEAH